MRNDNIT